MCQFENLKMERCADIALNRFLVSGFMGDGVSISTRHTDPDLSGEVSRGIANDFYRVPDFGLRGCGVRVDFVLQSLNPGIE
jgi:hypothetical protein